MILSRGAASPFAVTLLVLALCFLMGQVSGCASTPERAAAPLLQARIEYIDEVPIVFQGEQPLPEFGNYPQDNPYRKVISLDGQWRFRVDEEDAGLEEGWYRPGYDDSDWLQVGVPGPWDLYQSGKWRFYDGAAWYRRRLVLPEGPGRRRWRLECLGITQEAVVYVNGVAVARRKLGYLPFSVDVTSLLRPGVNTIAVLAWRRPWGSSDYSALPPGSFDWWPYAGIIRPIRLVTTNQLHMPKVVIRPSQKRQRAEVIVTNTGTEALVVRVVFDSGLPLAQRQEKDLTVAGGATRVVQFPLPKTLPQLWSPDRPMLYLAQTWLVSRDGHILDYLPTQWGRCQVALSGSSISVNGQKEFLKGVNWHADYPEAGPSLTERMAAADLRLIKSAGANTVRLSHYPRQPLVYRWADQNGLYLIDEVPVYWLNGGAIGRQLTTGTARAAVAEMVWNGINHPSILIWSLMNECDTGRRMKTLARRFVNELVSAVRMLDTRPVTYASNHLLDDAAMDLVDVVGVNEYFGFFYGTDGDLDAYLHWLHQRYPAKPVLITEFGNWAVLGTSREKVQAATLKTHWRTVLEHSDYLIGALWWVFADHQSRHQPDSALPYISTMGLVDYQRKPKEGYRQFAALKVPFGTGRGGESDVDRSDGTAE